MMYDPSPVLIYPTAETKGAQSHTQYIIPHTQTHTLTHTHTHTHTRTHPHVSIHTHLHTSSYIYTHTHTHTDTHIYIRTHTHLHTSTHTHIHIYTHTNTLATHTHWYGIPALHRAPPPHPPEGSDHKGTDGGPDIQGHHLGAKPDVFINLPDSFNQRPPSKV